MAAGEEPFRIGKPLQGGACLLYTSGYRSYREKLVGYYDKYNIKLTADDIIITSGGSEAVLFSFMACLNPS